MTLTLRRLTAAEWRAASRRRGVDVPADDPAVNDRLRELFGRTISPEEAVRSIVDSVRDGGDAAVLEWTRRIDGVAPASVRASHEEMAAAWQATSPAVRSALQVTALRLREFHDHQTAGGLLGAPSIHLRPTPLRRAGAYVPGGTAAYPSTVIHTAIPAQVAGVDSIAMTSPPTADGRVHAGVLAAAHLLGLGEVLAIGGAQAIAALAYGTETISPVDKIVGPGNLFVTLAKRMVVGVTGIDGLAGPSEIVVVAAQGATPAWIAHDLVSQLEHDALAWAVCLTDSEALATDVTREFERVSAHAVRAGIIGAAAGQHGAMVLCRDLEEALELADDFAPEHLELHGPAAETLADRVRCAGAIFIGGDSPVPMGDYLAGPNHTLPTGGAARYAGPLSVMDFTRWTSVTRLTRAELERLGPIACDLAEAEGLHGHAESIRARLTVSPVPVDA